MNPYTRSHYTLLSKCRLQFLSVFSIKKKKAPPKKTEDSEEKEVYLGKLDPYALME